VNRVRASFSINIGVVLQHAGCDCDCGKSSGSHAAASFTIAGAVAPAAVGLLILQPAMLDTLPGFARDLSTSEDRFAKSQHRILAIAGITISATRRQLITPVTG